MDEERLTSAAELRWSHLCWEHTMALINNNLTQARMISQEMNRLEDAFEGEQEWA